MKSPLRIPTPAAADVNQLHLPRSQSGLMSAATAWPGCWRAMMPWVVLVMFIVALLARAQSPANSIRLQEDEPLPAVRPIPLEIRQYYRLHPFFRKYTHVHGFPIVSSDKPSDYALLEAAYQIREMTRNRPEILRVLGTNKAHVVVLAVDEFPSQLPFYQNYTVAEKEKLDRRARAYASMASEENLLKLRGDWFPKTSMFIHEFAHQVHVPAMKAIDPTFGPRLKAIYQAAKEQGKFRGEYRMNNPSEHWAVGVERWFLTKPGEEFDEPELGRLIAEAYGNPSWRYKLPQNRSDPGHLTRFDRQHAKGYDGKLLDNRYARFHEQPRSSKQVSTLVGSPAKPTQELLAGKRFRFSSQSGNESANIGTATLNRDGTISGIRSPNESSWTINEQRQLLFKHRDGRVSTIFTQSAQKDGNWSFSGPFQFRDGVEHVLVEVASEATDSASMKSEPGTPPPDASIRLKTLKQLYEQGLITKDDYDKKVKEILESL